MTELSEKIKAIENQIEKALWDIELHEELEKALEIYREAESKLAELGINADDPAYAEEQRVLSYCLMRQGNILRQMSKPQQALEMSEREIVAARASGDEITLARSLMSNGVNRIVTGGMERGLEMISEAQLLFKKSDSSDYRQGLGWTWILQADLANARLVERGASEVIEMASRALDILTPIENWPGVARAYAARATVYEKLGNEEAALKDRQEQKLAESKINPEEESNT